MGFWEIRCHHSCGRRIDKSPFGSDLCFSTPPPSPSPCMRTVLRGNWAHSSFYGVIVTDRTKPGLDSHGRRIETQCSNTGGFLYA